MRRRLPLLLLPFLVLAACLEFDAQEVVLHYDAKRDRLDLLIVYRDLFIEGSPTDANIKQSLDQLADARRTGEFAFWSNWPFATDPTDVQGPAAALVRHVDVENGGLFTDPGGRLNAYQFVRVRDVEGFLKKLNTAFAVLLRTRILGRKLEPGAHEIDEETTDLLTDILRGREDAISLVGTVLRARIPCSDRDHRWLKRYLEDRLLTNYRAEMFRHRVRQLQEDDILPKPETGEEEPEVDPAQVAIPIQAFEDMTRQSPSWRFFWDNDITFERSEGLTVIAVGLPHVEENRIHKAPEGRYDDRLLKLLRERNETIEESVPIQEIERRFADFHDREAHLPPALAEIRQQ